ncbi:MAG TPA: hypothetical protein VK826_00555 [Bacteroidia bacterium]|nr:hypothetical protein [Bacteroidia bacterium]
MKTLSKITLVALVISAVSFTGCKKGEGDPFLSLKSRKARVAGEWKMTKGEGTHSEVFANTTFNSTITYDGNVETTVTTSSAGSATTTDKYNSEMTFEKDGTFSSVYTDNNGSSAVITNNKGNWNFTSGVGDMKNKSQIIIYITETTTGSSTSTFTGSDRPTMVYDLYQLKGKEIILHDLGTQSSGSSNTDIKWTLEPK